jgi:hypothetical protein
VVCHGGVRECSTSHGKVVRTREKPIAEVGTDKPQLDSTTQAALKYSRGISRVLHGRSRVQVFVCVGFVAHRSWREEEERVSAGVASFARFKKGPK